MCLLQYSTLHLFGSCHIMSSTHQPISCLHSCSKGRTGGKQMHTTSKCTSNLIYQDFYLIFKQYPANSVVLCEEVLHN